MWPLCDWAVKGEITWVNHKVGSQGHCTALLSLVDETAGSGQAAAAQKFPGGNLGTTSASSLSAIVAVLVQSSATLLDCVPGKLKISEILIYPWGFKICPFVSFSEWTLLILHSNINFLEVLFEAWGYNFGSGFWRLQVHFVYNITRNPWWNCLCKSCSFAIYSPSTVHRKPL